MVYPLVALFFGTGNVTSEVSAAVVARVFLDKSLAIFDYDPDYLLNQTPTNIVFDDLQGFYAKMKAAMQYSCRFLMGTRVTQLIRSPDGKLQLKIEKSPLTWRAGSDQHDAEYPVKGTESRCQQAHVDSEASASAENDCFSNKTISASGKTATEDFDEVVFACPANVARQILSSTGSWWQKKILSNVEYYHDLTVTHTDADYMKKHNVVDGRAIYFIKTYDDIPSKVEMGFDLTAYQPTLHKRRTGNGERIFQTIYLDGAEAHRWTINELNPSKIVDRAWWVAFSHTYRHFRNVVPWVWTIQGRGLWFAGSWTLFNTHDIAISSGLAAAHQLGAPYPFVHNELATATFDTVLAANHLSWRSSRKRSSRHD